MRQRMAGNETPLSTVPQPGAELFCPTCSSEARPDDQDTATCGSCGTLSPLDSMVAYSNFIHHALHYGIRVRAPLLAGAPDDRLPPVSKPFPLLAARVGSLIVLGCVAGMRRSQLEEMLTGQKALLGRWLQKELEEGDAELARSIPSGATALEIVEGALTATFQELDPGFPGPGDEPTALGQVFKAVSQYYKFRTSSVYLAQLADGILMQERRRLGIDPEADVPIEDLGGLIASLDPETRAPIGNQRAHAGEETLVRALARFVTRKHQLVEAVYARHRVTQTVVA